MERRSISISGKVSLLMVVFIMGVAVRAERVNKSTSIWSTTEDEGYLSGLDAPESDDDLWDDEENHLHFNGGFSSLDGMLQWSIGHSDPAKLEEAALGIQNLSPEELEQRQLEIKELMEKLKTPSDAKLMQIAIDDLNNLSLPFEDRHRALQELLILVEPIDNANDLHKLGGLTAVIRELNNTNAELRTISAWILGKASQNNHFVKNQTLKLGTLAMLIKMVYSDFVEEATKALYAVSALVRNNMEGQELFYLEAGDIMLQKIISNSSTDIRLRRKSVSLLADLVECQLDNWNNTELPFFSNRSLLKSVVDLLASQDLDLQEKALHAVKNLLLLRSVDALVLKDFCELDAALGRLREQLQQLILGDTYKDYALDLENLCREVELIFLGKLEQQDCKKCSHGQPKNSEPKTMSTDSTTSSKRKNSEAHLTKSMIPQLI